MPQPNALNPKVIDLLAKVRQKVRRFVVWETILIVAIVLTTGFWGGLAIDFLPVQLGGTEMPRSARGILLLLVLAGAGWAAVKFLGARLFRPLPDESLALLIERHHREIDGRLITAVQLSASGRTGDTHSPDMLQTVRDQATAAIEAVDINRLLRFDRLRRLGLILMPLLLAMVGFGAANPSAFALATKRLTLWTDQTWPRRADLSMVGIEIDRVRADEKEVPPMLVEFVDRKVRLPRGSSGTLRIHAAADDNAVVPRLCSVYYRTDDGTTGQSSMRRVGRVIDGHQTFILDGAPLADLSESMTISVRGLDDRLDDYRVIAVDPPTVTRFTVKARYPDYLRSEVSGEFDLDTDYQPGLRIREGSRVSLVAEANVPLGDVDLNLGGDLNPGEQADIQFSDDRRRMTIDLKPMAASTMLRFVPATTDGITARSPLRYFLGVVVDEKPAVNARLRGIGAAVTPTARLPAEVTATDDYGIRELTLNLQAASNATPASTDPIKRNPGDAPPPDEKTDDEKSLDKGPAAAIDSDDSSTASLHSVGLSQARDGSAQAVADIRDLVAAGKLVSVRPGDSILLFAEARDGYDLADDHVVRSDVLTLEVVTPEQLLALLERRELGLRSRLEQTIDETRLLRESIDAVRLGLQESLAETGNSSPSSQETQPTKADPVADRDARRQRLRVQQHALQASKTTDELNGIIQGLDALLEEMINNRVDSVDRRDRLRGGVREPLAAVVDEPLADLNRQLKTLLAELDDTPAAVSKSRQAVQTAETVILRLTEVLEKMLELESYNEILDLVRGIIRDQENLREQTQEEQKQRVLDLFK